MYNMRLIGIAICHRPPEKRKMPCLVPAQSPPSPSGSSRYVSASETSPAFVKTLHSNVRTSRRIRPRCVEIHSRSPSVTSPPRLMSEKAVLGQCCQDRLSSSCPHQFSETAGNVEMAAGTSAVWWQAAQSKVIAKPRNRMMYCRLFIAHSFSSNLLHRSLIAFSQRSPPIMGQQLWTMKIIEG